ncbi:MAG TPA: hypothetical protein VFE82_07140 [Ramlibacter sp.]|jgi:hypothetical protein|uniref:hypothetical protein n=1 Tax=Ramlibacter sp. TaxID=1917967 RepID=UPI002D5A1EE8|nr:hypothetical protein [Ramlibacter sp.]HZY18240.1 hypothetical protein [Ramlibacter sp.]
MVTDDARVVDARSCQLESWARHNRDGRVELWAQPGCNVGGAELTAGGSWQHADGHTAHTDRVLQAKTLWRTLEAGTWAWGTAVGVVDRPEDRVTEPYFYVPASVKLHGEQLFGHLNVGMRREGSLRRNVVTGGLALEGQISQRNWLVGETFAQDRGRPFYQAGLRHWIVQDRMQVDATVGDRIGAGGRERWFSIGLRLLSPPFLP